MEKKEYIAPRCEIIEMENAQMLCASNGDNVLNVYGDITDEDAKMSNSRRGTWGNLWKYE